MTNEQKKELFPLFAFIYSKKAKPEVYGELNGFSQEEFSAFSSEISNHPEDIEQIASVAGQASDEDWEQIAQYKDTLTAETDISDDEELQGSYSPENSEEDIEFAKKGAKIKMLQKFKKKHGSKKVEKCECGCEKIEKREAGGKITSVCSCCKGGSVKPKVDGKKLDYLKKIKK